MKNKNCIDFKMRPFNSTQTTEKIVSFLKTEFEKAGFSRAIIGLSGGVDSATSAFLAVRALGEENVHILMMPYQNWHEEALKHAQMVIDTLKIPSKNVEIVDIASIVDAFILNTEEKLRLGNIMARVRMVILFDRAKAKSALVLGTENKSEHLLGYFTRFGDEASDIEPIRSLYKTEVYQLAGYLGVPQEIRDAKPTAGLWSGQTDEKEFGFSYTDADEILWSVYDNRVKSEELIKKGFSKEIVESVLKRVADTAFKHHLPKILNL